MPATRLFCVYEVVAETGNPPEQGSVDATMVTVVLLCRGRVGQGGEQAPGSGSGAQSEPHKAAQNTVCCWHSLAFPRSGTLKLRTEDLHHTVHPGASPYLRLYLSRMQFLTPHRTVLRPGASIHHHSRSRV